ncbi:MAG: 2-amino-4-hydroxy-6-hydroxymethyldihydropteridine diphosphokinase [Halioglobus sp.]|nr:2-amino-4-hydroxy-6-hydroxymethyldihydropteridine diphosphokinase [Halioglobus sp.]
MTRVYVGIGSNQRPKQNLRLAIAELAARYRGLEVSPVYRNAAVGFRGDDFLNMVARFDSGQSPGELLLAFERIHDLAGRVRGGENMVSRTLDIDLLLYGDLVQDEPPLPREDILDYPFVLKPLADLAPKLRHPVTGLTMAQHLASAGCGAHRLDRVDLNPGSDGAP